jgi:lysophospholipase L1-like esterase
MGTALPFLLHTLSMTRFRDPASGRCNRLHGLLLAVACLPLAPVFAAHDGDINGDSSVNLTDLLWGIQALTGLRMLTGPQQEAGDVAPQVNGYSVPDGTFNLGDLIVLSRAVTGTLVLSYAGVPANQFNIGDSIGEGEAETGGVGVLNHDKVWSTGYNGSDGVNSINERLEALQPANYFENSGTASDALLNQAHSSAVMGDFATQAQAVVAATAQVPGAAAGDVVVLLGANDVCAPSLGEMTDPALFDQQFRNGLDVLAASPATRKARIDVVSIPAIYWLWNAKYGNFVCRIFVWPFVPCQDLLSSPNDDCANAVSRQDPDNDYPGDGSNCQRRKQFHRIIRSDYNSVLHDVLAEYHDDGRLPNARYTDLYDVRFDATDVNNSDCFHPSEAGHALLADTVWCRSPLGSLDPACNP